MLAGSRQHLSDEAEPEQGNARHHQDEHEIQQWAKADAVAESQHNRGDADHKAKHEQDTAGYAEEQHRLSTEAQLEPHGQHVHHPYGDAADAELGRAGAAGV